MAVILVTGMSGTGKSAVLDRLAQRGLRAVDTDHNRWINTTGYNGWIEDTSPEPLWRSI